MRLLLSCLIVSAASLQVWTAPLEKQTGLSVADVAKEEHQLEDLKNLGKQVSLVKSHSSSYSNVNGNEESHSAHHEQISSGDHLVAAMDQQKDKLPGQPEHVQATMDIPDQNVHKVYENDEEQSQQVPNVHEVPYTPMDMASYIMRTGDENGVTTAVQELINEGVMSREEAVGYLQEIKYAMNYLQSQSTSANHHDGRNNNQLEHVPESVGEQNHEQKKKSYLDHPSSNNKIDKVDDESLLSEQDYHELLDRLRAADYLYTEYSLEEIIYQLAKVIFTESLDKGNGMAQDALQKFANFLEEEVESGKISQELERKVLDVLMEALVDTIGDHPEVIRLMPGPVIDSGEKATAADDDVQQLQNLKKSS